MVSKNSLNYKEPGYALLLAVRNRVYVFWIRAIYNTVLVLVFPTYLPNIILKEYIHLHIYFYILKPYL